MIQILIYILVALLVTILVIALIPTSGKERKNEDKKKIFTLMTKRGKITFGDPFDNFLVYGGANSGKTKSLGKPLLREYIRNGFAGFIYDYKDFDLTKTAYSLVEKYSFPYQFYYISFTDMDRTYRVNPIAPDVIQDDNIFLQLIDDMLTAYMGENSKKDEWFYGALGILKGVAIRFYLDFPNLCTIPHIVNLVCMATSDKLTEFLNGNTQSRILASAFLNAADSPKTQASYLSSLTNYLAPVAQNKRVCYVLSGNDFEFNLIDPESPKLVAVANAYQIENVISPIISLMISASSRRFTLNNQVPFVYFLDEATTFKISDFEKMPSVLREYKCSFTFITQSAAKIEKRYSRLDRSSIEANFSNQFFGRTKDIEALKTYPLVFGKEEKKRISKTSGASRGGESRSRTISTQKEDRYDTSFFTNLKAGEFIGSAAHSNYKNFHLNFVMYNAEEERELPIVKNVLPSMLDACWNGIISDLSVFLC